MKYDKAIADEATLEKIRIFEKAEREYKSGIESAREEERKRSARRMIEDGLSDELVSRYSGLSINEVLSLR